MQELQARIAARLNEALDRQMAGGFEVAAERGLAAPLWPNPDETMLTVLLSVEDVARIAAEEAAAWF